MNNNDKRQLWFASGLALCAAGLWGDTVYFKEDFRNYRDRAPLCAEGIGIRLGNDPIWTQRADATCLAEADGLFFAAFQPAVAPAVSAYAVAFQFRFQAEGEKQIRLILRGDSGQGKTSDWLVDLRQDGVEVGSRGVEPALRASAKLDEPLVHGQWHECFVTVQKGRLAVHVSQDRLLRPAVETAVADRPLAGINFEVFKGKPFALTDVVVSAPRAVPDRAITRLLPVQPETRPADFRRGGAATVVGNDRCGAVLQVGAGQATAKLALEWTDGSRSELTFGSAGIKGRRRVVRDGKSVMEDVELPDAVIAVGGLADGKGRLDIHIRPKLRRYHTSYSFTDDYHDIVRDWDLLPAASAHPLRIECVRSTAGTDIYLDGSYAATFAGRTVRELAFTLSENAALGGTLSEQAVHDASRYLPLDIGALGMARAFAVATCSVPAGWREIEQVPFRVAPAARSGDVGLVRQGQGNWALEVDEYSARSPFDGLLTELHFEVPGGVPYYRAWVLCAVDPDPSSDPVLTARIARYIENGAGNNCLADTTVTLPRGDEPPGEGVKRVGSVSVARDGRNVSVPLYLVEIPLRSGDILDRVMRSERLNFEFLGKLWENLEQIDNSSKPHPTSVSAVQIFGVTLEKGAVGLDFEQAQPANVFAGNEEPFTTAILRSQAPAAGQLRWKIVAADGSSAGKAGASAYRFDAAGVERRIKIPLAVKEPGWFGLEVSLEDADGRVTLTHPAAFAVLGADTRLAGVESPFGIWWFDGAHDTPRELEFAGPVMRKAGIRAVSWTGKSGAELDRYGLYNSQFNMPFAFRDFGSGEELAQEAKQPGAKTEAAYQRGRERVDAHLAKHPHTREVLIFHESGPGNDVPVELFGLQPDRSPARVARERRYADLLNIAGSFFRRHYPQLKTVLGNNSSSAANVAAVLRHGGKPEYIDYIGIEAPSQVFIPEKLQEWALQGQFIAIDTAKAIAGRAIPATGCYEFTYRCERDMGLQQQAEWYARDVLISHANGFTRIGPGILFDCATAYYNGLWGGSGLLWRGPYGYPKPAYVAYAVLTEVLDRSAKPRRVPTGSSTVYAVEFTRADGRLATALWASRGQAVFDVDFGADTDVTVVEMYGRRTSRKTAGNRLRITAGTSPAYLLAPRAIQAIALAERAFPKDGARADVSRVVAPLSGIDSLEWREDASLVTPLVAPVQLPVRQVGAFEMRQVDDAEKGACVEIALRTDAAPEPSKYVTEYGVWRLRQPAAVDGAPVGIGVWVKGNSNWGRILFELEDAEGEVWRSVGTSGWGCDILDWPGNAAVNFDGWNFVSLALSDTPLFNDHSPGPVLEQWVSDGGNKVIDFPVKVRGLIVEMNRQALDVTGFVKVEPTIRLKDLAVF